MLISSSRKTVDKALHILSCFSATERELSVGQLSERLGLHKSVVSRLVSALVAWRMLERDLETQKLRVGEGAYRVGSLYAPRDTLSRVSKPYMEALANKAGQSTHLSVLDGDEILVVATVESPKALRVIMRLGERRPLHSTAAGKLFLAMTEGLFDSLVGKRIESYTPQTISAPSRLKTEIARIGADRISWNNGENSVGAGAVAAPVFDRTKKIVAALSTVYPLSVVHDDAKSRIARLTGAAAKAISNELGSIN